ncbi:MAG TPA: Crp/Fnr family transcriptional regulator [Anaerolineae bacterium]|nr:Crp/Fnr family transcriptional regulator [Anaerolineae bacterium]HNT06120.1 Crp/Fnr family transcriptional regulator [Anaerolineae bacterium]
MPCDSRLLQGIPLLAGLPEHVRDAVAKAMSVRSCSAGELLLVGGERCEAAYFVLEGAVTVFRDAPSGRQQVLKRIDAGQPFNLVPALRALATNHASAQAVVTTRLLSIGSNDLRGLIRRFPDLGLALLEDLADKLDHLTNLVETIALRSVRGRLARFLLDHAESGQVPRRWTLDEIAAQLGTVRDMVGRSLRGLADAGLIDLNRERIVLLDRSGLELESTQ